MAANKLFLCSFGTIRPTSHVCIDKIQKKCCFRARLFGSLAQRPRNNLLAVVFEYDLFLSSCSNQVLSSDPGSSSVKILRFPTPCSTSGVLNRTKESIGVKMVVNSLRSNLGNQQRRRFSFSFQGQQNGWKV